ncbi:TetR/AcrR family transcriptional regulator [Alicyclobacillus dauci]|uniref:WHG domain-containing protein n=1 Tax=Alicyclobacillus dauci TaxID=1475485 RepID=A0ABY6Z083_9BACL|nr:TetR/AcrR family transcriptional regulator [Alicyclobacillus dauci]WAH36241.1 WHG domain-containing protein [Alicyclobacillus dauci]
MASRPGLNKMIIVNAAGELADEIGLDKLTLSLVADRLGVRTPSLYNHIEGLDGLKRELSLLGLHELDRCMQRAAIGKAGHDAIASMLHAYRAFAKERPGVYESTLRAPAPDDLEVESASKAIIDTVLTVLKPYQLKSDDAIHVVRAFRAIGHGFATLEGAGAFGIPLEHDESYQRLISTFLSGLDRLTTQ